MKKVKWLFGILLCAGLMAMMVGGGVFFVRRSTAYRQAPIKSHALERISVYLDIPERKNVTLYAARGLSASAPENTIEAIRAAGERGFRHIQLDVTQTADGVPILLSDDTLERMTKAQGRVTQYTAERLSEITLDNGANIEKYTNVYIPDLRSALQECGQYGMTVLLNVRTLRDAAALQAVLKETNIPYILSSEHKNILRQLAQMGEEKLCYAVKIISRENLRWAKEKGYALLFEATEPANTDAIIAQAAQEIPLFAGTVSDRTALGRMARLGVQNILTDRILPEFTPKGA